MKNLILCFSVLFLFSCSDKNSINDVSLKETDTKIKDNNTYNGIFETIPTNYVKIRTQADSMKFYSLSGESIGTLAGQFANPYTSMTLEAKQFLYLNSTTGTLISSNGNVGIQTEHIIINNKVAKTYTEEFEDKQGNTRTRIYENGLLVSYKINGIEQ
jgi:hypothetical protein